MVEHPAGCLHEKEWGKIESRVDANKQSIDEFKEATERKLIKILDEVSKTSGLQQQILLQLTQQSGRVENVERDTTKQWELIDAQKQYCERTRVKTEEELTALRESFNGNLGLLRSDVDGLSKLMWKTGVLAGLLSGGGVAVIAFMRNIILLFKEIL